MDRLNKSPFQRILCAVDGSENSVRAAEYAANLATLSGGTVVLMSAYHVPNEMKSLELQMGAGQSFIDRVRNRFADKHKVTLGQISEDLMGQSIKVETTLQEGAPGPAIVKTVKQLDCDVVVVGSRGAGDFKRFLLGSVSDYVVHHSKVPCLVVP